MFIIILYFTTFSVSSIGNKCFEDCLFLRNVSLSFLMNIQIKPLCPWLGEKETPFFPHSNTNVFMKCPFNENKGFDDMRK
jgi:hypothetical protein